MSSLDLLFLILLLGGLLALLLGVEALSRRTNWEAETSRKIVHLGAGISCLFFPWLFDSTLAVLVLALCMSAVLTIGQRLNLLTCLTNVQRQSRGSELYPLAIFLTFALTTHQPWLYVAAILVLGWADAGAALIGTAHGRHRYFVNRSTKSVEGSAAFFAIALCGIAGTLAVLAPLSIEVSILSAFLVALVVTAIEAISDGGRDNLFVPLAVVLILQKITTKPVPEIVYQNASLFALFVFAVMSARTSRSLNAGATLAALLFVFACWSLGSEIWALPGLGGLLLFITAAYSARKEGLDPHIIQSSQVVRALTAPLVLLLAANFANLYDFFLAPFVIACTVVTLSFSGRRKLIGQLVLSVVAVFLPVYLLAGPTGLASLGIYLCQFALCVAAFHVCSPKSLYRRPEIAVVSAVCVTIIAQHLGLSEWDGFGSSVILGE